jgi:putative glycosyltransferase (TIGR04372 family)
MYRAVDSFFSVLNAKTKIIIQTPNRRSFGDGANEMYFGLLKAKREKKKVLFVYPRFFVFKRLGFLVVNPELFKLESELTIPSNGFLGFFLGCLLNFYLLLLFLIQQTRSSKIFQRICKKLWPIIDYDYGYVSSRIGRLDLWKPHDVNFFSVDILENQKWSEQHRSFNPMRIKESKRSFAESQKVKLGVPSNAWFVCLHCRETQDRPARNVTLNNYIDGIKTITDKGGWVVRLGHTNMPPLPEMERVVDYAHSPLKSPLLDLYLISECRFFIGHSSGPNVIPNLLKKPVLLVNMTDWSASLLLKKGDLAIMKHVFSHSKNRFLGIKEVLEEPSLVQVYGEPLSDYELIENSSKEILEAIEEFLERDGNYKYSSLQIKYNEARMKEIKIRFENGDPQFAPGISNDILYIEKYRIGADLYADGTLCNGYLQNNWLKDCNNV